MGQPVVHFEVIGKDGPALQKFFGALFDWEIDADNPANYGIVTREGNTNADGIGIGGGVSERPPGVEGDGHVTFYVEVPSVEDALAKAQELGGTRVFGPADVPAGPTLGMFLDPEGHLIGVVEPTP